VGDLAAHDTDLPERAVGENASADEVPAEVAGRFAAGLLAQLAAVPPHPVRGKRVPGRLEAALRERRQARRQARSGPEGG
jgi:hypothetical protein